MRKNYFYWIFLSLILSSCAKFNNMMDKMYTSDKDIKIQTNIDSSSKNKAKSNEPKSTAIIHLNYLPNTYEIDAHVDLKINSSDIGNIYLSWEPPKKTKCYPTSFMLMPDKNKILDTQLVLDSNNQICKGKWKAIISNKKDKNILAKASIDVISNT